MQPLREKQRNRISDFALQFATRTVDGAGIGDSERLPLIRAFATVPREVFLESALSSRAFEDHALPIGFGQTISKPSTVARMLASLELRPGERVLEIGAGSGYVLALLSAIGVEAFGVEKLPQLARLARRRLDALGLQRVVLRSGDGKRGWPDLAPFDAIIVSAAFEAVPQPLFDQLVLGGRIVAPIIVPDATDQRLPHRLSRWQKTGRGADGLESVELGACHFVNGA